MQNIRLDIQYDGSRYLGWQRPEKDGLHRSVSYKLNEVLNRMTGEEIHLCAGARTDPGVHALAQTVSFQTEAPLSPEGFLRGLSLYLPQDITVLGAQHAPDRFRADLNALSRTYEYRICTSEIYDVFHMRYESHCFPSPDLQTMGQAAAFLKGRHDFRCFSSGRKKKGTEKEILDISFIQEPDRIAICIIFSAIFCTENILIFSKYTCSARALTRLTIAVSIIILKVNVLSGDIFPKR